MQIEILQDGVDVDGDTRSEGDLTDVDRATADLLIANNLAKKADSKPAQDLGTGPWWEKRITISDKRNLQVTVWPPGGEYNSPSLKLRESRDGDDGWETTADIYLPTGDKAVAIAHAITQGHDKIDQMRDEEDW